MTAEQIKTLFLKNETVSEENLSIRTVKRELSLNLKRLRFIASSENGEGKNGKWVKENTPYFISVFDGMDLRDFSLKNQVFHMIDALLENPDFSGEKDEISSFFDVLSNRANVREKELFSIKRAFFICLAKKICHSASKDRDRIPHFFTIFHKIKSLDFDYFAQLSSPLERELRFDPSGIYVGMTKGTQMLYKSRLKRMAKRRKMSPEVLCRELMEKARKEGKHIGTFLEEKPRHHFYFPIIFVVFFFLLSDFAFELKSILLTVLISLPLYYFTKELVDFIVGATVHCEELPAMKMDRITEENKTCVVITSLLNDKNDVDELFNKLRQYQVNNYQKCESIYFGLLCDLPESRNKHSEKDDEITEYLKEVTELYNKKENVFFSCVRERRFHTSEGKFVGWERKRGAIEQLVGFLCGRPWKDAQIFGNKDLIVGAKFIITLDGDTRLMIGQARRLVGIAAHPLNEPIIEKRNGRSRVISGYGILQPRITTSLLEKIKTPFGKILGNGSGNPVYAAASYDAMQTFFGEGNFCGKGIFHVRTYDAVLTNAFPEQKILSHDMPEGALLRCALVTNEYFSDSNPQTPTSFYKRQHRWVRGDVQNINLISQLSPLRKVFFLENLLRYFKPLCEFLLLLISGFYGPLHGLVCAFLVLLFHFEGMVVTAVGMFLSGNVEHLSRRFSTKLRNLLLNSFYQCILSLAAIPFEAYYYSDAIFRSLYRMFFSRRKLLEWQVYSPIATSGSGIFFFLPSWVLSAMSFFFAQNVLTFSLAFLWAVYPLLCLWIATPYKIENRWKEKEKSAFRKYAEHEFRFFSECVGERTKFLPPDNIQLEPVEKIAMRTSPTNIGLYLASLVAARDFEIISTREMVTRMKRALETLSKLERWHGHLYNWYDLNTLEVIGDRFVSTVDSGNYIASLIAVSQALEEYKSQDGGIASLKGVILNEIRNVDFRPLISPEKGLFSVGILENAGKNSISDYDLYMSEARITAFLAIGMGQISPGMWSVLSRPLFSLKGRAGIGSWTGTAFEYFMPPLFLPVIENSMEDESLDFALYCQTKYGANITAEKEVFGISESGYHLTDAQGNYQYKAFGVPFLSVQPSENASKVISPYSSFLMLERKNKSVLKNLEILASHGLIGPYGFFEAVEFHSRFLEDYTVIRSYMAHHKGMSILALTNAFFDNIFQRRFLSYGDFDAKCELLAERFPLEGKITKRRRTRSINVNAPLPTEDKNFSVSKKRENTKILTDGKMTLLAFDTGENRLLYQEMDLIDFEKGGLNFTVWLDEKAFSFYDTQGENKFIRFGSNFVEYQLMVNKATALIHLELISGKNALLIRSEVQGYGGKCAIEIGFDAVMQKNREYRAHPAFQALSLEGTADEKHFVICRRGVREHSYLHFNSTNPLLITTYQGKDENIFQNKALIHPTVSLRTDFKDGIGSVSAILLSFSEKDSPLAPEEYLDGSYYPIKEIRKKDHERLSHLERICFYDNECKILENKILLNLGEGPKYLSGGRKEVFSKEVLWKYGVSSDFPIISIFVDKDRTESVKTVSRLIRVYKKLSLCGFPFDLIILHKSSGEYFNRLREELTELVALYHCEFLVGKHPGIHFVVPQSDNETKQILCAGYMDDLYDLPWNRLITQEFEVQQTNFGEGEGESTGTLINQGFVIEKEKFCPTVPFSFIVSNRLCGFLCDQNSLGYTWFRNSGLNRISKWENILTKDTGEKVYLLYEEECYDLLQMARKVTYQRHCVIYDGRINTKGYRIVATASELTAGKVVFVSLDKALSEKGKLYYSFVPVAGKTPLQNVLIEKSGDFVSFSPVFSEEYGGGGYFCANGLTNLYSHKKNICFELDATEENLIFLGGFANLRHLSFLKETLKKTMIEEILSKEKAFSLQFFKKTLSPEKFWIQYQAIHSRFFGRTGMYQSSGAYGFRDQLQDSLLFLKIDPYYTALQIIRSAAHQFEEGDVQHWWHTIRDNKRCDPGIRSRCSDDYLWLLYAYSEYEKKTNDTRILDTPIPFLKADALKDGEVERYFSPQKGETAPLKEHLRRAVLLALHRGLGEHLLPDIGSGDWNDGMNEVGGESIWLGFFSAICLNRTKELFDSELQAKIQKHLSDLARGLRSSFNGAWFTRVIRPDGTRLGDDISLESECSIDLITQAFAAFYNLEFSNTPLSLDDESVFCSIKSASEILSDVNSRTTALFTKPFSNTDPSPGYIQRYCSGVRENGGQYTHAAVWFALGAILYGRKYGREDIVKIGKSVARRISPFENISKSNFRRYQREPYVLCGDVYTAEGKKGHGGWSWYTGAAGWYLTLLDEMEKEDE